MTSSDEEMEPCPFCGGEPEIINCSVHCNNPFCEAQPFTAGQSSAEAIAAWNRRTLPANVSLLLRQAAEALTEIGVMYAHTWDRADDGALVMMPSSIPRFEAAHAKVQKVAASLRQLIGGQT